MSIQNNIESLQSILTAVNELPDGSSSSGSGTLQTKTVTPTANAQTIKPDSGYNGLSQVTINGDSDLIASNIRKSKNIFGVTGTLEEKNIRKYVGQVNNATADSDGYFYLNCGFKPDYVLIEFGQGYWNEGRQQTMYYTAEFNFDTWENSGYMAYGPMLWVDDDNYVLCEFYDPYRDNNGFGFEIWLTDHSFNDIQITSCDHTIYYEAIKYT